MNFGPILAQWPVFAAGFLVTLTASVLGSALALATGVVLGIASQLGNRALNGAVRAFVYVFRGIPLLVLLFFAFYALPIVGLVLPDIVAGILALGVVSGAYMVEVVRSALESVDKSQSEAAQMDGASVWVIVSRIVFPQAMPQMVAPLTNDLTALVMATSLLSVISISDLTRAAQLTVGIYFDPFEAYVALGLLYLIMTAALTWASIRFERWLSRMLFASPTVRRLRSDLAPR
jgi:His/Glu/Gln/Arg/opine family amino acid ABC transporter permease subunit